MTESFVVGLVGSPFGLKGFVKVRSLSGETEHLTALTELTLRQDGRDRVYPVEAWEVQAHPSRILLAKFAGIDAPEEAKGLNGAEIVAGRTQAAPLKPGEFYVEDLKGLDLVCDGEVLGRITDMIEGGGGDLAEVRLLSGETRLVPFRKEFFGDVNPEAGKAALLERWIVE
ncbi:MAG: ribosome maturation factor RimM [Treponema sp.]|nr:ribosome maturation factor RimM [Treponema sp.]